LVNYINPGTIRKSAKRIKSRRLQKAPELNVTRHPRKKHLEEETDHLDEVGPEGAHPCPISLVVGPFGLPQAPPQSHLQKVLPTPMSINLNHS
jgi:hypothetical protein